MHTDTQKIASFISSQGVTKLPTRFARGYKGQAKRRNEKACKVIVKLYSKRPDLRKPYAFDVQAPIPSNLPLIAVFQTHAADKYGRYARYAYNAGNGTGVGFASYVAAHKAAVKSVTA